MNVWIRTGGRGGADAAVRPGNRRGTTFKYLNLLNGCLNVYICLNIRMYLWMFGCLNVWMFGCIYTYDSVREVGVHMIIDMLNECWRSVSVLILWLSELSKRFEYLNVWICKKPPRRPSQPPDLLYLNVWMFESSHVLPSSLFDCPFPFTVSFRSRRLLTHLVNCLNVLNVWMFENQPPRRPSQPPDLLSGSPPSPPPKPGDSNIQTLEWYIWTRMDWYKDARWKFNNLE